MKQANNGGSVQGRARRFLQGLGGTTGRLVRQGHLAGVSIVCTGLLLMASGMSASAFAAVPDAPRGLCVTPPGNCAQDPAPAKKKYHPGHYMLVYLGSGDPTPFSVLDTIKGNPNIHGVQIRYLWKQLEPQKNQYDFSAIERDLKYLGAMGKRLVVQLNVNGYHGAIIVPDYLRKDPAYEGGIVRDRSGKGWVVKRWNLAVQDRMGALYRALAERFDDEPYFEAFNVQETASPVVCAGADKEPSYSPERYRDAIMHGMDHMAAAWKKTTAMQWFSYLPCGKQYLADVAAHAAKLGLGIGGPDLEPGNEGQETGAYQYYETYKDKVVAGQAVQTPNWGRTWPNGKPVTAQDMLLYGANTLHLDYIFWLRKSPEFFDKVVPLAERYPDILGN